MLLAEACTVIRRLWTGVEPFDFDGTYLHLIGAFCNPKPVQRPYPPILIGGRSTATLRVVAEHANLGNIPGGDIDDAVRRGILLDRFCAEIGRDPTSITRSIVLRVSYDHPSTLGTRSLKPSTPASSKSSYPWPPHIPKTSHDGSPTSSSTRRPRSLMGGVSGRVSVPQRRDAWEAIYEPPDRSLWLYIWEVHGWNLDTLVSDRLSF